jgi:hypothetical protein
LDDAAHLNEVRRRDSRTLDMKFDLTFALVICGIGLAACGSSQTMPGLDAFKPKPTTTALLNGAICGVVGTNGHLYVDRFDGSGFTDLGGQVVGKPSCTYLNDVVQAFCGVRGTDSAVYVNFSSPFATNPSWSGFQRIGGVSISDPVCTSLFNPNGGQAICAIIRPNGALAISMTSDGSSWAAFADRFGGTQFNPTSTIFFNGGPTPQSSGALCGAVTTAGGFQVEFFNGETWTKPQPS